MKKINIISINVIIIGLIVWSLYILRPVQQNIGYILQDKDDQILIQADSFDQLERYKQDLHKEYQSVAESIDKKFNVIMVVIGIALSVWVSLNIYNIVQKDEIDKLKNLLKKLELQSKSLQQEMQSNINKFDNEVEESLSLAKIEINYLNVKNIRYLREKEKLYNEIINLIQKYPQLKDNEFKSQVYLEYVNLITPTIDITRREEMGFQLLEKALELTNDSIREAKIHRQYAELAYTIGKTDKAIFHARMAYEENKYDYESLGFLLMILDYKNTSKSHFELINLIKENDKFIRPNSTKELKEALDYFKIKNIYTSEYGDELEKILK